MQLLLPLLPLSRQVPSHYLPILPMYLLSKLFRDEERRRKKKKKETTTKLKRKKKKKKRLIIILIINVVCPFLLFYLLNQPPGNGKYEDKLTEPEQCSDLILRDKFPFWYIIVDFVEQFIKGR